MIGPAATYSWSLWEYLWEVAEPGSYELRARATSTKGQVQPEQTRSALRRLPNQLRSSYLRSVEGARRTAEERADPYVMSMT